jgi:hypothetical protein
MCVIVDANVAHKFGEPPHQDVQPVVAWLFCPKQVNRAVLGGKLRKELDVVGPTRRFLRILRQAGRVSDLPDGEVDAEEAVVVKLFKMHAIRGADDPHILALARLSGARLLVSADRSSRLHELFKDTSFVARPQGKIYQNATHKDLLRTAPKCKERNRP